MAPLLVITGPTASGKSSIALRLAERWGGEIICADSRTVYKGLDIGTAKPTVADRERVRHHLLDVVRPDQRFTAYDFYSQAQEAIAAIRGRNKIPLLVGGTGLYIDSIILDFQFGPERNEVYRRELEAYSVNDLKTMLKKQHISLPKNENNHRHLVRTLERADSSISVRTEPIDNSYVVAIATDRSELVERIERRIHDMFMGGVLQETAAVAQRYGWECEALSGNIYPLIHRYLQGELALDEVIERCRIRDRQLAKRQITWLKRHAFVRWLEREAAEQYFDHILADFRDAHPY